MAEAERSVDARIAAELGFPKLKYTAVERERRWLCSRMPVVQVLWAERIVDLYVENARLRLRRACRLDGSGTLRRLTKKADLGPDRRLITSVYLDEAEFSLLADLPGRRLTKVRHHLGVEDTALSVDVFEGALAGLILAEAEFRTDAEAASFPSPEFAEREVTGDPRYTGGVLAWSGLPDDYRGEVEAN
jgi:CYTH domain-containing protein